MKHLICLVLLLTFTCGQAAEQILITETSVGKITKKTKPEIEELSKLYPTMKFKKELYVIEGDYRLDAIIAYYEGKKILMLLLDAGKTVAVTIYGNMFKTSNGNTIGDNFGIIYKNKYDCVHGHERYFDKIICDAPIMKNANYTFSSTKWKGQDGEMPPKKILEEMKLEEIEVVWEDNP